MKKTLFLFIFLSSCFIQDALSQTPYLQYNCDTIFNLHELSPTEGSITAVITNNATSPVYKDDALIVNDAERGNVLYLPNMLVSNKGDQPTEIRSLRITSTSSLVGTGDYTITFRAKIKDYTGLSDNGFPEVFTFDGSSVFQFRSIAFYATPANNPGIRFKKSGGTEKYLNPSINLASMKSWHQYVIIKTGSTLTFYVDNVLKGTNTSFDVPNADLTKLRFNGNAHGAGTLFDDIQIFQQGLVTTITTQPVNQTVDQNTPASFSVVATGLNLHYQWKKGSTVVGSDAPNLSFASVSALDAGTYSVVVTGSGGFVTSSNVTLSINNLATSITTHPTSQVVTSGQAASFSVEAIGTNLHYQWKKGTVNVGTDSPTLSIAATTVADAGDYSVVVSGDAGVVESSVVSLTVNLVTSITNQPSNQFVMGGKPATFSVVAIGTNLSYQWKKDGNNIDNATLSSYTLTAAKVSDMGTYSVIVTGDGGVVTSSNATLTVYVESIMQKKNLETANSDVISALSSAKNSVTSTDVRDIEKINLAALPAEYSIEVKAKINTSTGRGLDIEARDANKTGFRFSVNTENLSDYSLCNAPFNYTLATPIGTGYHTYRFAVKDGKVNIYVDKEFFGTKDITLNMRKNNLIDNGGFEQNTLDGWSNPTGWGRDIVSSSSHTGTNSLALGAWHGQVLVTQYYTPVAPGDYEFSFYYKKTSGNNYRWGIAGADGSFTNGEWNNLNVASWTVQNYNFTSTANTTATFSLWEWNNGSAITLDDVELTEAEASTISPYINFGKAFGKGTADMDIAYVNYDLTGAYAPDDIATGIQKELSGKTSLIYSDGNLIITNTDEVQLQIYSVSGIKILSKTVRKNDIVPIRFNNGVYIAKLGCQMLKFVIK